MGLLELKNSALPTVPWEEYTAGTELDDSVLWTIRSAVFQGNDFNLPRSVGKDAAESEQFAGSLSERLSGRGIVLYYPYFIAKKSGTLNVYNDRVIIEAVKDDLWNLVTYSKRDVTVIIGPKGTVYNGSRDFLTGSEISEIFSYVGEIRGMFRDDLTTGKSILLEWSYAYACNKNKEKTGRQYLVFYEARTVD